MNGKKCIILALILLIIIAIVAIAVIGMNSNDNPDKQKEDNISAIEKSKMSITMESAENITGFFVEDGSDETLDSIFAADFKNDGKKTLEYAKIAVSIDDECYEFELTTIPAGETVRAMEINRKEMPESVENAKISIERISWFESDPSMCADIISVVERNGGLVVENKSDDAISAPIHVYYKNYIDGIYVGGITYRATVSQDLEAGEAVAIPANHFDPDASKLMFIDYAS